MEEMGEEMLSWACSQCERKKADDLHAYTNNIFRLRQLQKAGYPFAANDLTLEEWEDLGRAEEYLTCRNK